MPISLLVNIRERHLVLDVPPLYVKVGFAREKGGFHKRANIAFFYDGTAIRLARALGRGMRAQKRLPRVSIYGNSVQLIGSVDPIPMDCKAALNKMLLPRLAKKCEQFSMASVASFTLEELPTFTELFEEQESFAVEIYGPRGESLKSFETFIVPSLGDHEQQVVL